MTTNMERQTEAGLWWNGLALWERQLVLDYVATTTGVPWADREADTRPFTHYGFAVRMGLLRYYETKVKGR